MAIFTGAGVAIVTPMLPTGEVNYDKLGELIEFQIENHTDAIIICGTTGESSTLTHGEHLSAIKYTVDKVAKRVPVIAGTGSNCTETAIMMSKEAESYGADALLLVTPYYNKATQNGLIAHFTAIANAVSIPIILYNVPSRTGCNIMPETAVSLARNVENIVAIKEASGNISQIAKLMSLADGCIDLYSGNDDQVVPLLSLGGKGCEIQLRAIELVEALFCEVNPIPVKAALNLMGKDAGPLRLPLTDMEPANLKRLEKAMIDFGIKLA